MKTDLQFYLDQVQSEECICGRTKKDCFPFCWRCFKSLPEELQEKCRYGVNLTFPETYEEAVKFLSEEGLC